MVLTHNSFTERLSATKYAELFPTLIIVKRGSPENGGDVRMRKRGSSHQIGAKNSCSCEENGCTVAGCATKRTKVAQDKNI